MAIFQLGHAFSASSTGSLVGGHEHLPTPNGEAGAFVVATTVAIEKVAEFYGLW